MQIYYVASEIIFFFQKKNLHLFTTFSSFCYSKYKVNFV